MTILTFLLFAAATIHYRAELGLFSVALLEPIALMLVSVLLSYQIVKQRRLVVLNNSLVFLFAAITLWALIVGPLSVNWQHGLSDMRDWAIPVIAFIAMISTIQTGWRNWLKVFVSLGFINAVVGIYQHLTNSFRPFATELTAAKTSFLLSPDGAGLALASPATGFFSHPNALAMYLFLALLVVLGWPVQGKHWWLKLTVLLPLLIALFWTYAKASLLVMASFIFVLWLVRHLKSWSQFVAVCLTLLILAGSAAIIALKIVPPIYLATFWWRVNLWQTAIEVIRDTPQTLLIGNGLETFALQAIYPQPHNLYLYLLLSYGLPGLALLAGLIGYLLNRGRFAHQHHLFRQEPLLGALWTGMVGYLAIGLVESNLLGIESRMIFLLFIACFSGLWREVRHTAQTPVRNANSTANAEGTIASPISL